MGKYIDFIVPYSSDPEELGSTIIEHITCNRLQAKKPSVIFLTGDSGEGKSYTGLKILDIVNQYYGIDTIRYLNDQVVYTPLEYTRKLDAILHDKEFKKVRILMIDEAREVIRAQLWYTFINRAIADCNAMSRRIKPLVLLIVSQFIKDIDSDVRRTLVYYGKCARPLKGRTQFELWRIWKDDSDIERPRLRKRRIKGYVKNNGVYSTLIPNFEVKIPPKKIVDIYEDQNFESKSKILRKKLEDLMKILDKELGHEFDKVNELVDFYLKRPDMLRMIIQRKRNRITVKQQFRKMHELTNIEIHEFEKLLIQRLADKGIVEIQKTEEATT
jgi:hypothetical protein